MNTKELIDEVEDLLSSPRGNSDVRDWAALTRLTSPPEEVIEEMARAHLEVMATAFEGAPDEMTFDELRLAAMKAALHVLLGKEKEGG